MNDKLKEKARREWPPARKLKKLKDEQGGLCKLCDQEIIVGYHGFEADHRRELQDCEDSEYEAANAPDNVDILHTGCHGDKTNYYREHKLANWDLLLEKCRAKTPDMHLQLTGKCQHDGCGKATNNIWCAEHGSPLWARRRQYDGWTEERWAKERKDCRDNARKRRDNMSDLDKVFSSYDCWIGTRIAIMFAVWKEGTTTGYRGIMTRYSRDVYERFIEEHPLIMRSWRHETHQIYFERKYGKVTSDEKRRAFLPMVAEYYKNRHRPDQMAWYPIVRDHFANAGV